MAKGARDSDRPDIPGAVSRSLGGGLSIGALSRATGIPVETLRTWELRYGYPVPERKPSGQRVYLLSCIPRLRRIAEALFRAATGPARWCPRTRGRSPPCCGPRRHRPRRP